MEVDGAVGEGLGVALAPDERDDRAAQPLEERLPRVAVDEDRVELVDLGVPCALERHLGGRPHRLVPHLLVPAVLEEAEAAHHRVGDVEHAAAVGEQDVVLHEGGRAHLERLRRPLPRQQRDVVGLLADRRDAPRVEELAVAAGGGAGGSAPEGGRGRGAGV